MPLHKSHCINLSKFLIQQAIRKILTWLIPYGLVARIPGFHPGGSG